MMDGTQPLSGYFGSIPGGLAGVKCTMRILVNVCRAFLKPATADATQALLTVRLCAQRLVQPCQSKDYWAEAVRLHSFVCHSIRYTRDMRTAETVQYPNVTLGEKSGDCDDKCLLMAALAECVGFETRFLGIGVSGEDFSHVSSQLMIPGFGWTNSETIPMDDVGTYQPLGWTPPDATCFMLAHV